MQQYFSNNLSLKSLMYKIREQNVVFTASKPNNVIDVNIVYRISEFIMADTQSTKQSSK